MKSIAAQLSIRESTVKDAVEVFKLAQVENFIQGRRISEVAAVSLYVACRRNPPCRVMLIEFSDKISVRNFQSLVTSIHFFLGQRLQIGSSIQRSSKEMLSQSPVGSCHTRGLDAQICVKT